MIKANCTTILKEGDVTLHQYFVGRYRVTVNYAEDDKSQAVKYVPAERWAHAREPDIDVEIKDRQIVIDLDQIVTMALERAEPMEIAQGLWQHDEVREAFCDLLAADWTNNVYGEVDREWDSARDRLLKRMNQVMLAQRINRAANALRSAEYYERKYWELYHALNNQTSCSTGGETRPDWLPPVRVEKDDYGNVRRIWVQEDPEHKIGSQNWIEARDWWRQKIVDLVAPEPELAE